jgi:multiple sugar transport system substrate-binding protein
VHEALRKQGMRRTFGIGLQVTTVGPNDGNNLWYHYMIANGGQGLVTKDGSLHIDDPKVRDAAIHSVEFMTGLYKGGYVPPEALSWNDADDNNAYHSKLFVMDFDGTLSTELAQITKDPKGYHEQMKILNVGKKNDGSQMLCQVGAGGGFVPRGAKNVPVAKDFMKYFIQPAVMNENLKNGLGRWVPAIPQVVKDDSWWTDPKLDPFRSIYTQQTVLEPTIPNWIGFNPALGQVNAEQVWGQCHADVIKNGMKPKDAVDKAFKRTAEIFEKFSFE